MLKKFISILLAVILVFAVAGCSGTSNTNEASGEIVIGFIGPTTGSLAIYGEPAYNGAELFFSENPEVLGKKIKFVPIDDQGDPVQAVSAYNKLVEQNNAVAIIGAVTSKPSQAVAEESQKLGTPIISPSATAVDVTSPGENMFRACYLDSFQGEIMAKYCAENGLTNMAVLYCQTDDYSVGLLESFREVYEANGGTIVATEAFSDTDTDYKSQLTKIKETNPQALFIPYYYTNVSNIAGQMKDIGFSTQLIGVDGWDGVLDVVNDVSIVEGALYCNHYTIDDPYEKIQSFVKGYNEKYGKNPNAFAGLGYDAAAIMYEAIKNAGSEDSKAIVEALKATDLPIVTSESNAKFDASGNPIKGITIVEIIDGKNVVKEKME